MRRMTHSPVSKYYLTSFAPFPQSSPAGTPRPRAPRPGHIRARQSPARRNSTLLPRERPAPTDCRSPGLGRRQGPQSARGSGAAEPGRLTCTGVGPQDDRQRQPQHRAQRHHVGEHPSRTRGHRDRPSGRGAEPRGQGRGPAEARLADSTPS